jgi:hypothetical protein
MIHFDFANEFTRVLCRDSCISNFSAALSGELADISAPFLSSGFVLTDEPAAWYFYFLLIMIVGYAVAKTYLGQLLPDTFLSTVRYNFAEGMFKDNSQLQRQIDNVLYTFYFFSVAFFMMFLSEKYTLHPLQLSGPRLLIFYFILLAGLFFGKMILVNITGHIFFSRSLFREYLYTGYSYNKLMGILFLPLNFVLVFTSGTLNESILYLSLLTLIMLLIVKIFRGLIFSMEKGVFSFYLFLYLCALEIVPILLLYKWFSTIV